MRLKTVQFLILLLVTFTFMDYEELSLDDTIQVYDYTEEPECEVVELFNYDDLTFIICHDSPENPPVLVQDVQL